MDRKRNGKRTAARRQLGKLKGYPAKLAIASYNVHRCIGTDRRLDPGRVVQVIQELDADIVGVQEVDSGIYCKGGECQMDRLAQIPGYEVIVGPTIERLDGKYGNALLCRWPVKRVEFIDLSVSHREPRGAIDAILDVAGIEVRVVAVHLGLRAFERRLQYQKLNERLGSISGLTIVLGDFNEWKANAKPIRKLVIEEEGTQLVKSFPSRFPVFPLDRIYTYPGAVLGTIEVHQSRLSRFASDHLPIKSEIDFQAYGELIQLEQKFAGASHP